MPGRTPHIAVCICTFHRAHLLPRLLNTLAGQETGGLFTYSITVVDNDGSRSAEATVAEYAAGSSIPVRYCVEPRQNIALARNKAVEHSQSEFIAFIDDDEFPIRTWLLTLFNNCLEYDVDGVLGPVKPHFDESAPRWVIEGKFYERETYPTGLVIDWRKGRTGNVLLKKSLFTDPTPFNPDFRTGEDQEFFHRMINAGHKFIWCNEAVAFEVVPPIRWKRTFMLRRALLRGAMEPKAPDFGARSIAQSALAVFAYVAALTVVWIFGHHKFMSVLIRLCDHLGKLLAATGIEVVKDQYVVE
jgi:glycosyltransferase involved in cell wall biosynthesis